MAEGPADTPAAEGADSGVLAGLPATRPNRMGRRGRDAAKPVARATKAKAKAKPRAKAKAKAKPKAAAKPKVATAPEVAAAQAKPTPIANGRKPRPVRAGHPGLDGAAGDARRERTAEPDGTGLVDSVTGAAAAGVRLGGRLLKGVAGKLPKP